MADTSFKCVPAIVARIKSSYNAGHCVSTPATDARVYSCQLRVFTSALNALAIVRKVRRLDQLDRGWLRGRNNCRSENRKFKTKKPGNKRNCDGKTKRRLFWKTRRAYFIIRVGGLARTREIRLYSRLKFVRWRDATAVLDNSFK